MKNSLIFSLLIILIGQIHGQQVQFSRPMIAVKKNYPAYEILINGKKLPPPVVKDITRIAIHERLNDTGSFNIRINNWDNESRSIKYSKPAQFKYGDRIEISLLTDKNEPSLNLLNGIVKSINDNFSKSDSSILVINGLSKKPEIEYQTESKNTVYKIDSSNRNLFKLKRNMAENQIEVSLPVVTDKNGFSGIRVGRMIRIDGIGERYQGLYYVSEVTHTFSLSGYRTSFKLSKNTTDD